MDNINLSQTVALNYEQKKELKKLHVIKYQPEGRSSKAKLIVLKATNHNNIESRVTKGTNHGEKDSNGSKGKSKEKTDSGLSHKDQTFGRGGKIMFNEDNNTHYNYSKTKIGVGGRSSGGRGRGRGKQGRRGSDHCTATVRKN